MTRFEYIQFDEASANLHEKLKFVFYAAEEFLEKLPASRAKALCLTKLEESCMWAGKAIRDEQIVRRKEPPCTA